MASKAETKPHGSRIVSALSTIVGVLALLWFFGGESDPAPQLPDHVQRAESAVSRAYARQSSAYRCRSAEFEGAHYILCGVEGMTGGALYAVLDAEPGRSRIAPQTGKAAQDIEAGYFAGRPVDLAPTSYGLATLDVLSAFK